VTFTINAAMLQPIVALLAGILILLIPRILNFVVAIYFIFVGVTGLWPHLLIRPSALMGPTGNYGMPRTATAASKLGVFDLKYNT
jgi:hypothetical protein